MTMAADEIEKLIKEAMPDADVTIKDLVGDGDHYAAHVVSSAFEGKSRVQQHQLVYEALGGRMGNVLHALALTTAVKDRHALLCLSYLVFKPDHDALLFKPHVFWIRSKRG